jgi:hypothetical protein
VNILSKFFDSLWTFVKRYFEWIIAVEGSIVTTVVLKTSGTMPALWIFIIHLLIFMIPSFFGGNGGGGGGWWKDDEPPSGPSSPGPGGKELEQTMLYQEFDSIVSFIDVGKDSNEESKQESTPAASPCG